MKIVYDHQIFTNQVYGGVSRYFYEIAARIGKDGKHEVTVLAPTYANMYLKNADSIKVTGRYLPVVPKTTRVRNFLNEQAVRIWLRRLSPDIVHETFYLGRKLASGRTKTVVTVHDMVHELFRDSYPPNDRTSLWKAEAVKRSDAIICVSEKTRNDMVEMFDPDESKITVIPHGISDIPFFPNKEDRIIPDPYLLFVGLREKYKNFTRLLEAFVKSPRLYKEFVLVCFGGGKLTKMEIKELVRLGINSGKLVQMSGGDTTLGNLYSFAHAFVFPSLYEGFGMPLLEAMSCRCPVVCSRTGSFSEVAGEAAEFFDPYRIESISSGIENVVFSGDRSRNLVSLGMERIRRYSWEACAEQTEKVYSKIM